MGYNLRISVKSLGKGDGNEENDRNFAARVRDGVYVRRIRTDYRLFAGVG